MTPKSFSARAVPYLMLAPVGLLFTLFMLYPMLRSLALSFSKPLSEGGGFAGLSNYARMLRDPNFWTALGNSSLILFVQVPLTVALALSIAIALASKRFPLKNAFRSAFFVPSILSLVAVSVLFRLMFNEDIGLINALLQGWGLEGIAWNSQPAWARLLILLVLVWRFTGFIMVIFLAAILSIRPELYEAASLDGAGGWQQFRFVTLPQIRPTLIFIVTLSAIGALQVFEEVFLITGGGPANSTLTLGLYLYRVAFVNVEFPYASALSWFLLALVGGLSYLQFRVTDRQGEA